MEKNLGRLCGKIDPGIFNDSRATLLDQRRRNGAYRCMYGHYHAFELAILRSLLAGYRLGSPFEKGGKGDFQILYTSEYPRSLAAGII